MNTKELRLGNLVYGETGEIETITAISEDSIVSYAGTLTESAMMSSAKDFSPIPLTEGLLIELGFEQGAIGYYHLNDIIVSVEGQVYFGEDELWICELHLAHQLQNLYFALTGNELTLKNGKESNS